MKTLIRLFGVLPLAVLLKLAVFAMRIPMHPL